MATIWNAVYLILALNGLVASGFDFRCVGRYKSYCVIENVTEEALTAEASFPPEQSLLIQNSTIPKFGSEYFLKIPSTENLMIHHLKIEQLQLENCPQLTTLFASYNHISELTVPARGLPLRNLHLYQNMLTNVSAFRGLTALEQLYLHDNLITTLEMDVFADMKSLKILTLHRNQLTAIDTKQAVGLPSLESLFLQHNELTYLDTGLWRMPALQKMDISANKHGFLFTFLEELPALKFLELHDNKWNCAWLYKMMDRMEARGIKHSQADQSCEGTLFGDLCCLSNGAAPDPMMLLISRTAIVDDLQDQLGHQKQKVEHLEESQRKQAFKFDEMKQKIDRIEKFCREDL